MSSRRVTSVTRASQYRPVRSAGGLSRSAVRKSIRLSGIGAPVVEEARRGRRSQPERLSVLQHRRRCPPASLSSRPSERRSATGHAAPSSASSFARLRPLDRLGDPGRLDQPQRAHAGDRRDQRRGRVRRPARAPCASMIARSRAASGNAIQWYRQRRLSASCSSRVRLEVITTIGGVGGRDRPQLGDRDLEVAQELEQERLELRVRAVDLVDQQHARHAQRAQQRALHQELRRRRARRPARPSASQARIASSCFGWSHSYSACAASSPS